MLLHAHRSEASRVSPGPRLTRTRRRNRRDRGIRGPLTPRAVPLTVNRATEFDGLVVRYWDRLCASNPDLIYIDVAISDVPDPETPALARFEPAHAGAAACVTIYRWPLEMRADSRGRLRQLVADVLLEEAAAFLGVQPQELDSEYVGL